MSYPVPANETERLRALDELSIEAWGVNQALDKLCSIASKQLQTPIALVSLIGATEQYFPAKIGVDIDRTPREVAFCAHAIMSSAPLVIENAGEDERFANNPFVTGEPGVAAYAGVPLETASGLRLGTLCAIDLQPHKFTEDDIAFLSDLSKIAMTILEAHRTKQLLDEEFEKVVAMQDKLAESDERYALCLSGSAVGLWDWNIAADHVFWSDRLRAILGITDEGLVAELASFEDRLHPDDHDRVMDCLRRHLALGAQYDVDYRLRRETGDYVWIHSRGQAIWDDAGRPTRMAGSAEDISDRKSAELQLAHYSSELERSNQELDQFAYIASHDLKAPLRVIENASNWLEKDLKGRLTEREQKFLHLLRNRVQRMEKLLDDLLTYSRFGRTADDRHDEIIAGSQLIDDIVELLTPPPAFTIEVPAEFAEIWIARMPLQQVFYNLINNAIKHHDRDDGTISLKVERSQEQYRFTVSDDGPGIPPQYHQQIFEMFKTLRPRDEVEGSGMGLALVKKAVEQAGGMIEVSSGDGRGAAFTFIWPNAQEITMSGAAA